MLTNQDRRAILEQVKTSGSGDIIAALRGQVSTEPIQASAPTQEPVNIPQSPQPIDVDIETTPALPSNLVDSTASLPTQLAKEGGVKSRDGSTYVINKKAVITDPVRNTEYFSQTPMYEGQPHSTHLMSDDNNLTAWPSIFQDKEGNWFRGTAKEAEKRGELYKFDTKEEMIDFARKGNWKNKMNTKKQTGGEYFPKFPRPEGFETPQREDVLYETKEKSLGDKILNVLANPLASFGRLTRGEDVNPGNIKRGENAFDAFVLGMVNPASWVESGQYAVKEAKQGNYLASGLNALGVLPIVPAGIKGVSALKNIVKTSPKMVPTTAPKVVPKSTKVADEIFKPSPAEEMKINAIKKENISYLRSNEYMSKRMANTGESKESILRQIDDYIKELDETPLTFKPGSQMNENTLGYYRSGDIFKETPSELVVKSPPGAYKSMDKNMFGTVDHEIKHLLSPAQKVDKSSPTYKLYNSPKFKKGREKFIQDINDINDKFNKATTKEEADKVIAMFDKVPNKAIYDGTLTSKVPTMEMSGVYKNYPTLKINSANKETAEYLGKAKEQQPRLLRGAQWVKDNFNWDGTKSGITDKMVDNIFNQMQNSKNLGGKTEIPDDFRTLLENSKIYTSGTDNYGLLPVESYRKLKNVLSKAWAAVPVAVGAGAASEKRLGGFEDPQEKLEIDYSTSKKKKLATTKKETNYRQHMMNYLHTSGRDTNMVNLVMNAIGQHESLNVADQKQVSQRDDGTFYDGTGRGAYQFEMSDKGAASTALNRNYRFHLFNTDKELKDFPEINKLAKEKNPDLSTTSRANQDGIFIGDKIFGGPERRNMFDLVTRNRTTSPNQEEVFQYWLKNHKGRISAVRDGEETTVPINEATKKEIAAERKKWNKSTKNLFKTGGYKSRYV